jgi:hypothetical protein
MSERLEAVSLYMKAKAELERAKSAYDIAVDLLKPMGTFNEGGAFVDVSVISRETIALGDIKKMRPDLVEELRNLGFIKTSHSDRLTVKIKDLNAHV